MLAAPGPCSYAASVDSVSVSCDDNDTPRDPTDDRAVVAMRVSGPDGYAMRVLLMRDSVPLAGDVYRHNRVVHVPAWPGSALEDSIRVLVEQEFHEALRFTVAAPGEACSDGSSGTREGADGGFSLWPTLVADGRVRVRGAAAARALEVSDLAGGVRGRIAVREGSARLPPLPPGTYVLRGLDDLGRDLGVARIVVQ